MRRLPVAHELEQLPAGADGLALHQNHVRLVEGIRPGSVVNSPISIRSASGVDAEFLREVAEGFSYSAGRGLYFWKTRGRRDALSTSVDTIGVAPGWLLKEDFPPPSAT